MGRIIINPGGAGGIDPDELTVTPEKVLAGEIFGGAGSDEPQTGTMDVQSILSFSAAPYSSKEIIFTWQNPAKGAFSGVIIIGKEGSYPENINDGTRYYKGYGDNPAANGMSSVVVDGFKSDITYYFIAFSYALKHNSEWVHASTFTSTCVITVNIETIKSSRVWTVPDGVRSIDVFLVGGGGGGAISYYALSGGGGGAGYTKTATIPVVPGEQYNISIGGGGAGGVNNSHSNGYNGGTTSFGTVSVNGGGGGAWASSGGGGGSGGGAASNTTSANVFIQGAAGGSNGSNGANGNRTSLGAYGGVGQGTTTRAFGEDDGTLYAYGGKGGDAKNLVAGGTGASNTGNGGGGGGSYSYNGVGARNGGNGGSGICILKYIVKES